MRRAGAILATVAAAAALGACGGDDEPSEPGAPTGQAGKAQIRELLDAFYSDDQRALCEIYTDEAIEAAGGREHCLDSESGRVDTPYEIVRLEIDGDEAGAVVEVRSGERIRFGIVPEDGEWKLSTPAPIIIT